MAKTFQRLNGPEHALDPGQYTIQTATGRPELCCPACSLVYTLPHGVDYNSVGQTNYKVRCPRQSCGWWEHAVLDSVWEES